MRNASSRGVGKAMRKCDAALALRARSRSRRRGVGCLMCVVLAHAELTACVIAYSWRSQPWASDLDPPDLEPAVGSQP